MATSEASAKPQDALAYKKLGDEAVASEDFESSARFYRQALVLDDRFVDARIGLAFSALELKQYEEAKDHLTQALAHGPEVADVHYMLARLHRERDGRASADTVIAHLARAIELDPRLEIAYTELNQALSGRGDDAGARRVLECAVQAFPDSLDFRHRLGSAAFDAADYTAAAAHYRVAAALAPESAEIHYLLAESLRNGQDPQSAVFHYTRALALNPDLPDARVGMGQAFEAQGRIDDAIEAFSQSLARAPNSPVALHFLGNARLRKGDKESALECFRKVALLQPDNGVEHLVKALSGGNSDRAPAAYVESLFDTYAARFDSHLVGSLRYSIPGRIGELMKTLYSSGADLDVLDLGCGTGLAGAAVAPYARRIVGVDLSAKMLEKAADRKLYQRLEQLELVTMMQAESAHSYDLIVAADVLVYVGRLDETIANASRVLKAGGLFAFSVASLDALSVAERVNVEPGFRLTETGRYAHSAAYLRALALRNSFSGERMDEVAGRADKGKAEVHYLCVWQRI